MDSSKVIKIALIGAGAFVLYEWLKNSGLWAQWFGGEVPATVPASSTSNSIPVVPSPPVQGIVLPPVSPAAMSALIQKTSASSDEWCWAYQHLTGTPCPSSSVIGTAMTAAQFTAALTQYQATGAAQHVGLSGIFSIYTPAYSWVPN